MGGGGAVAAGGRAMTVGRAGRGKIAAAASATAAAREAGTSTSAAAAASDDAWDDEQFTRGHAGSAFGPVSGGLMRTDGGNMRSPSSSAAAASAAFSARGGRRSTEAPLDVGGRRCGGQCIDDRGGEGERGGVYGGGGGGVDNIRGGGRGLDRQLVMPSPGLAADCPCDDDSSGNSTSGCSGVSSDDSDSVHEIDLPDMAEPASVFPQLVAAGATPGNAGPPWAVTHPRPPAMSLNVASVDSQWPTGSGGGQPLCEMPSSTVLSPASARGPQEPLALRGMGVSDRERLPSDAQPAPPAPPESTSTTSHGTEAVAPTAGEPARPLRRSSLRGPHASPLGASSAIGQPPPSHLPRPPPRERSRLGWDATPTSPHRSSNPRSPRPLGLRSGGSAALAHRGVSVDLSPSVAVSVDMRAASYAEEPEPTYKEGLGDSATPEPSSPLTAAIHASQLVGAGNRFSIASKMRRSSLRASVGGPRGVGAAGEDLSLSHSLSNASFAEGSPSGGGIGDVGAESSSGTLHARLPGPSRRSGGGPDGSSEQASASSGGTFLRAPKHSTLGRLLSPHTPSSATDHGTGGGAAGNSGFSVTPPAFSSGKTANLGGAASAGTGTAVPGGSGKPFFRRFSNVRVGANGNVRVRSDGSAGSGVGVGGAARSNASGLLLSGGSTVDATDRVTPVVVAVAASSGPACVSPSPFSPSEEVHPSLNGGGASTLVSAGTRSRRKIAKVFFSRKGAAVTPSSSSGLSGAAASSTGVFASSLAGAGGAGTTEEEDSCTAFTAAVPPSAALAAVTRVLLSAGCDMAVKRDRIVKVKVDAPLGGGLHLHVNVLLEGVAVAGDPLGTQPSPTMSGEGTSAEAGIGEAQVVSSTLVRLVRSRDDRGRTPQAEFVAFFHDFHSAFVQATLSRGGP